MSEFFDKNRNLISLEDWQELFANPKYKRVKYTALHDGTTISTVWLGLPHGYGPDGPQIFETLVTHTDSDEEEMYRYATEAKAKEHHDFLADYMEKPDSPPSRWWQIMNED